MTNKKTILSLLIMSLLALSSVNVFANLAPVPLEVDYIDPTLHNTHKGPVLIPEVSIEDFTLYFETPCDGCLLRVVNDLGVTEYSTIIPDNADELLLPNYLSGGYEIQIIRGNFCFYGYITL